MARVSNAAWQVSSRLGSNPIKELGVGSWMMRAPNHTWPEPRPLAGEATQPGGDEEDDDDEAGQDKNICKK